MMMTSLSEITAAEKPRRQGEHDRANRVRDVADIFGTSERHVWRLIKSGQLKAERLGVRCVRIFDSEIARYRESLRAAA
jgi:excisionase family DNA binding protein